MMRAFRYAFSITIAVLLTVFSAAAGYAAQADIAGLWKYREIVTLDEQETAEATAEAQQGVLLADLEAMPLDLLGRVFGKLNYTAEFTQENRFTIDINVLGMRFTAAGNWSVQDGSMTLVYDQITGFQRLWWLGSFDHLTHCDAEHLMWETVAYEVDDTALTFHSNGADLIFDREPTQVSQTTIEE